MLIFLIGYMGSGKTTIGKSLAARLNYPFMDTDQEIEFRLGKDIPAIFSAHGEAYFRVQEASLLEELLKKEKLVVSTGGGMPREYDHMEQMNRAGITIYLKMSVTALVYRLEEGRSQRPLIKDLPEEAMKEFIEKQLAEREPYYSRARYVVNALDMDAGKLIRLIGQDHDL